MPRPARTPPPAPRRSRSLRVAGPSLALRYPAERDAAALLAVAGDARVTRYFSWGPYRREAEPLAWVRSLPARRRRGTALEFVIVDAADTPIGVILLSELAPRDRRAVVGTWLGRAHWGTGANVEAKALVAALAFGPMRLQRLGAYADARNVRSQAALERLGFVREGVLRDYHRHGGQPRTVLLYSLLLGEYAASPLSGVPARVTGLVPKPFRAAGR
jgi:N-acetyltransferase